MDWTMVDVIFALSSGVALGFVLGHLAGAKMHICKKCQKRENALWRYLVHQALLRANGVDDGTPEITKLRETLKAELNRGDG